MNTQTLKPILAIKNKHSRDDNISFEEKNHKYTINEKGNSITPYISTTTFIHKQFENFDADEIIKKMMSGKNWTNSKYFGLTNDEIKKIWSDNGSLVSGEGTNLHNKIEKFMNQQLPNDEEYSHKNLLKNYIENNYIDNSVDWSLFLKYIENYPDFVCYRTEWLIYDEEVKIAGSIDMVYINKNDNSLNIYDWKRSKKITKEAFNNKYAITPCIDHLPDSNYFHYSLQLNIYKAILEKNYNVIIKDLYLIRLHPENKNNTFEAIKIINLSNEVKELFEYRKTQLKYEITEYEKTTTLRKEEKTTKDETTKDETTKDETTKDETTKDETTNDEKENKDERHFVSMEY
jgi:hypothetical protein